MHVKVNFYKGVKMYQMHKSKCYKVHLYCPHHECVHILYIINKLTRFKMDFLTSCKTILFAKYCISFYLYFFFVSHCPSLLGRTSFN